MEAHNLEAHMMAVGVVNSVFMAFVALQRERRMNNSRLITTERVARGIHSIIYGVFSLSHSFCHTRNMSDVLYWTTPSMMSTTYTVHASLGGSDEADKPLSSWVALS